MARPLTDAERFPLLPRAGRERLLWLQEHPQAPRYNHRCGERLDAAALQRLREYGEAFRRCRRGWQWGEIPGWLEERVRQMLAEVPFYRRYGTGPGGRGRPRSAGAEEFFAIPTTSREDLVREPWSFVPDSQPLDDLILYRSSHTS